MTFVCTQLGKKEYGDFKHKTDIPVPKIVPCRTKLP
jgi:hypothetical protein